MVASDATTTSTPVRSQSRASVVLPRVKDLHSNDVPAGIWMFRLSPDTVTAVAAVGSALSTLTPASLRQFQFAALVASPLPAAPVHVAVTGVSSETSVRNVVGAFIVA